MPPIILTSLLALGWTLFCDPECQLQRPETSKFPKVFRRDCKKCFGATAQSVSQESLAPMQPSWHKSNRLLVCIHQDTFCTIFQPLWAILQFPTLCSKHFGSQTLFLNLTPEGGRAGGSRRAFLVRLVQHPLPGLQLLDAYSCLLLQLLNLQALVRVGAHVTAKFGPPSQTLPNPFSAHFPKEEQIH